MSPAGIWGIALLTIHFAALLVGVRFALPADRRTRRVARDVAHEGSASSGSTRAAHLAAIARIHPVVMRALWGSVLSGLGLFAIGAERYITSGIFWIKMALVVALLANGFVMQIAERDAREALAAGVVTSGWSRLHTTATASTALWCLVAAAGFVVLVHP